MVDIVLPEAPTVPSDPYRSLGAASNSNPSAATAAAGVVFNSYCSDVVNLTNKKHQDYFSNSNSNTLSASKQPVNFGSSGDTSSPWRETFANNSNNCEVKRSFYLGADEDEEYDHRNCGSEYSEEYFDEILSISDPDDNVVGFLLDEDSGIGTVSNGPSLDEEAESVDHPSELVSLPRSLNIGSVGRRNMRAPKVKKTRLQFTDFYKLTENELGQGAYACVRTAVQKSTNKEFAVKLVNKHEEGHTRSRILREVEIFKLCKKHPNIVQLIEWFEDDDYFYMIFEKMRGGPLLNHIQAKSCFTEEEASQVTKDIASALKFLHDRGIAHRDVKPENILCTEPDRVSPVKLCDLDLASKPAPLSKKVLRTIESNTTGGSENATSRSLPVVMSEPDLASPVGSAEFMAPEVVDTFIGERFKYDKKCDLWALGVVIYVMLCGYPPFYGRCDNENCGWDQGEACDDCQDNLFHRIQQGEFEFPEEDWSEISESAKDLIRHLLVKDVSKRFTADEVLHHRWVLHEAPQTQLQTVNNLIYRKDSARDISLLNENFDIISRFASGNNPPIDEADSSTTGSPPSPTHVRETLFQIDPDESEMNLSNGVPVHTPTIHYPGQQNASQAQGPYVHNQIPNGFYVSTNQPQMLNMNGTIICAPQMAPNSGIMGFSHPIYPDRHNQGNVPIVQNDGAFYVPQVHNGTTYYTPAAMAQWIPSQPNIYQHKQAVMDQTRSNERPNSRSGTNICDAISKMGLETCQNAMNRQGSSKDIRNQQTRETQVNV